MLRREHEVPGQALLRLSSGLRRLPRRGCCHAGQAPASFHPGTEAHAGLATRTSRSLRKSAAVRWQCCCRSCCLGASRPGDLTGEPLRGRHLATQDTGSFRLPRPLTYWRTGLGSDVLAARGPSGRRVWRPRVVSRMYFESEHDRAPLVHTMLTCSFSTARKLGAHTVRYVCFVLVHLIHLWYTANDDACAALLIDGPPNTRSLPMSPSVACCAGRLDISCMWFESIAPYSD